MRDHEVAESGCPKMNLPPDWCWRLATRMQKVIWKIAFSISAFHLSGSLLFLVRFCITENVRHSGVRAACRAGCRYND